MPSSPLPRCCWFASTRELDAADRPEHRGDRPRAHARAAGSAGAPRAAVRARAAVAAALRILVGVAVAARSAGPRAARRAAVTAAHVGREVLPQLGKAAVVGHL